MANTKEIKTRIESVKDTRKITNAMYLIASTKLRKARNDLDRTRPYFEALRTEIKRIFRTQNDVDSRYFYPPEGEPPLEGTYACLVITADKGLAGAYNQNVIKEAMHMLEALRCRRIWPPLLYAAQYPHGAQLPLYGTEPYHAARERNLRHPARGLRPRGF